MSMPLSILLVAVGGASGAVLRFLLSAVFNSVHVFPWVTLGINIAGSLGIGLAWGLWADALWFQQWGRLVLVVGLLGGFTTFSAYSMETLLLFNEGRFLAAGTYVVGTVSLCLLAAAVGGRIGSSIAA